LRTPKRIGALCAQPPRFPPYAHSFLDSGAGRGRIDHCAALSMCRSSPGNIGDGLRWLPTRLHGRAKYTSQYMSMNCSNFRIRRHEVRAQQPRQILWTASFTLLSLSISSAWSSSHSGVPTLGHGLRALDAPTVPVVAAVDPTSPCAAVARKGVACGGRDDVLTRGDDWSAAAGCDWRHCATSAWREFEQPERMRPASASPTGMQTRIIVCSPKPRLSRIPRPGGRRLLVLQHADFGLFVSRLATP
jgi:hypothetical protein